MVLGSCISLERQKVWGLEISALGLESKAFYKPDRVKLPSAPTALKARRGQKWDPGKEACSEQMCPIDWLRVFMAYSVLKPSSPSREMRLKPC